MNILSAIRREHRKLEKQVARLQRRLKGLKSAAEVGRRHTYRVPLAAVK
jgi:hypothetical protein